MAIFPVTSDDVEYFTSIINPKVTYSSSSSGVTGSIKLFARGSSIEKEISPLANFSASFAVDENIEQFRISAADAAKRLQAGGSFFGSASEYLTKVNRQLPSEKKAKTIRIERFTPTVNFTKETIKKLNIKDILMPYYNGMYPSATWGYTNYNSLNFFSATGLPTSSVLLYPSIENLALPKMPGFVSGIYSLSGAFSFDFRINPRYQIDNINAGHFKAGTIFHLSSSYALSLVTGSKKDENGLPIGFRLQLQLSHSADIPPSVASPGSYPRDLIFLSDDNSLTLNEWQRVVVRWGTSLINDGTGSFNIGGVDSGKFVIPSGTIMPRTYSSKGNPNVLCFGNFFEGTNFSVSLLKSNQQSYFFNNATTAQREGLQQLVDNALIPDISDYSFNHPLKAEIHEAMIRREYMSDSQIMQTSGSGQQNIDPLKIAFYVPPFFTPTTSIRKFVSSISGSFGGVLQTPFIEFDGSTNDPFNVAMSFGVNGHYINLENFVKDYANDIFPRLHHLSGVALTTTTTARPANDFLYDQSFVRKRNLTVLPCDDGTFAPNYNLLGSEDVSKFTDSIGRIDYSTITLDNLLNDNSLLFGKTHDTEHDTSFANQQIGPTVENPGLPAGPALSNIKSKIAANVSAGTYDPGVAKDIPLIIYQNTKDPSSNQVTIFNISNLYYGSRILPGSFELKDSNLSGSAGMISITLKDDSLGNIYRADASTPHSKWNSVGNIFYNEGVVVIKSPHLYFFGKNGYEMSFKGEQQLHSAKYEVLAPYGLINSSSNPSYARAQTSLSASMDPSDTDSFVYISNINFHDENLNVVAKASLAQPIMKRENEKILFKIAFDF